MSFSGWNPLSLKLFVLVGTVLELSANCAFFGIIEDSSLIDDGTGTMQAHTYEATQSSTWSSTGRISNVKDLQYENLRRRAGKAFYVDETQETVEASKDVRTVSHLNSYQKHMVLKHTECSAGKVSHSCILPLLYASIIISTAITISCCSSLLLQHGLIVSFATITNRPCCNFAYVYGVFIGKAVTLLLNLLSTVLTFVFSYHSYDTISLCDTFLSSPLLQKCLLFTAASLNVATFVVSWVSAQQYLTHSSFYFEGSIQERALLREAKHTTIISNYSV